MTQKLRALTRLPEDLCSFSSIHEGGSQMPYTPAARILDSVLASTFMCARMCTHTIKKKKFKNEHIHLLFVFFHT